MTEQPFEDIPLFRELHKLLASGGGPVNFEIARQVGLATATQGSSDPDMKAGTARLFADAVHSAEGSLSGYTRLQLEEPARSKTGGRAWWVTSTLDAWRWLLERLATRLTGSLGELQAGIGEQQQIQAALGQVAPLLLGIQAGTLLGNLALESLGRYDWPIPRDDDSRLFLVVTNTEQLADDYGFEHQRLIGWLAVREVARYLIVASTPWVEKYQRSLLGDVVDATEIDRESLQRSLLELQDSGLEELQSSSSQMSIPIASTDRHLKALERLRAFLAAFEGYALHAAAAVLPQLVDDATRIDEAMTRRSLSTSAGESLLSNLLGVATDRKLESAGTTFCSAVVELRGPEALNELWAAPDNLPTLEEIKDPFAWMERALPD